MEPKRRGILSRPVASAWAQVGAVACSAGSCVCVCVRVLLHVCCVHITYAYVQKAPLSGLQNK